MEINNSNNSNNNDDNLKRDYYYYSDVNTKIEVRYKKNENGNDEKITKTYLIENYPSDICNKIKERQKWAKFGQAVNENNKSLSNFTDSVDFDINPSLTHFYYKKNNENGNNENCNINKKFYIDNDSNQLKSSLDLDLDSIKPVNIFENPNKKSLVNCRYCGENTHWSIQCPSKKEEKEIKEKKEKEENEAIEKQKYIEKEKEKYEKRKSNIGLKISDLDESLNESEIRYHFEQFGTIINFYMVRNKKNRKFNGTVYITYLTPEENNNALINIRTKHLNYLIPSVELAKPKEIY
jgi:hypothetical protein